MKKKVIGIAAGLILLAAAGGYAGVGHYYASHFFPKTAINGLNCAGPQSRSKRKFRSTLWIIHSALPSAVEKQRH